MVETGTAGQNLHTERCQVFQILERCRVFAGQACAAVVEQNRARQVLLLGERKNKAFHQNTAQFLIALAHMVGGNDNDRLFLRRRYRAGNLLIGFCLADGIFSRDCHAELLVRALFGRDRAALALRKAGQILHRNFVIYQRLHRARAVQILQRVQRFDDRNWTCIADRIHLYHNKVPPFGDVLWIV